MLCTRYDYENCESDGANKMMQDIETNIQKPEFLGRKLTSEGKTYTVKLGDNYSYTDPVDGSQASKQVLHDFAMQHYFILSM